MEDITQNKIEMFFSQFHLRRFSKGKILLQPEDKPIGAYFLKEGHIKMYGISPQGIEIIIHLFHPKSFFPMTWVLNDTPNRYYYEALTSIEVSVAPKDKVIDFLKKESDVLFDLTKRIFMGVGKLTVRMEHMASEKASLRVASIILYLARHFGESIDNKVIIKQMFTHRDIASLAGVSRETVSRELEKLRKVELVQYKRNKIILNDIGKLEQDVLLV